MEEEEPVTRRTGTSRRGAARPVTIAGGRGTTLSKNDDPDYVSAATGRPVVSDIHFQRVISTDYEKRCQEVMQGY